MRRHIRYSTLFPFLIVALLTALLSSCAKKADDVVGPGNNSGGGNGGSASDSLRNVIIDSATAFINRLPHISSDADNQSVLQYFRNHPEFEASGISPLSSVWARFTDGRLFVFMNDIGISSGSTSFMRPMQHSDIPGPREIHNLPGNTRVRLLNALGPLFTQYGSDETITNLHSWFNSVGYTDPLGQVDATVNGLRQVHGDGVFYMSTHGGAGQTRLNESIYCVWTSEEVTPAEDANLKLDLDSGYVVTAVASYDVDSDGNEIDRKHYAITPRFVTRYMSFGTNSLVYFNACGSNDGTFKGAYMAKGASVYFGWSKPARVPGVFHAARFLFDRLLGTNQYELEDPRQRPFNYSVVLEDMHHRGYDTTSSISPDPNGPR